MLCFPHKAIIHLQSTFIVLFFLSVWSLTVTFLIHFHCVEEWDWDILQKLHLLWVWNDMKMTKQLWVNYILLLMEKTLRYIHEKWMKWILCIKRNIFFYVCTHFYYVHQAFMKHACIAKSKHQHFLKDILRYFRYNYTHKTFFLNSCNFLLQYTQY